MPTCRNRPKLWARSGDRPGNSRATVVIAIARLVLRCQKRVSWGALTGMACSARKPVITATLSRRPMRVIAWPTVEQGSPTGLNSGPLAMRSSVAAIATSLEAIRPTTPRSGSSALMACCNSASSAGQGGIWMCCKGPRRRDWSRSSRICSVRPGRAGDGAGCCMIWSGWVARGSVRQRRGTASRCRRSSVHAVEAARKS
mmetsp:Transcript_69592/g.163624  ORF Transcript_69592/g.163624 Transcript_69592/m.163624 type:complete len:200 (-) Transcript_69592:474-1073(-)